MSDRLHDYIGELDRTRVTARQKALLFVLAGHYNTRYGSTNVSLETLANDMMVDRRWIRKIIAKLEQSGILGYIPGRGEGNYGQFWFPELKSADEKGVGRGSEGGQRGVTGVHAIRKDLNLNLDQNLNPPNPLFQRGDCGYRLTARQHTRLSRYWEKDRNRPRDAGSSSYTWRNLLRQACADLAIPMADAESDLLLMDEELWSSRLELKKAPQSA